MLKSTLKAIAGVILSVEVKLLQEALQLHIPDMKNAFNNITIPGGSSDGITYDKIVLDSGNFDDVQISLVNGSGAILDIKGISFTMKHTNFHITKHGISCNGEVWGSLSGANISGEASLRISKGGIAATVKSDISWGRLSLDHTLPNDLCKFVEDIVTLFVGDMNKMIEEEVKKKLPNTLNQVFQELVDKSLKTFGKQVDVDHNVSFDYTSLSVSTTSKGATFGVLGQFKDQNNPNAPTNFTPTAIKMVSSGKEATAWFSEFPFNTASEIYYNKGLLPSNLSIPHSIFDPTKVKGLQWCSNCTVWANFSLKSPPEFVFNGSPDYNDSVKLHFGHFDLIYSSKNGTGSICGIKLNARLALTFNLSNANKMDLVMVTMERANIWFSVKEYVWHVSENLARPAVITVVDYFSRLFNMRLPGIPLPVDLGSGAKLSTPKTLLNEHTVAVATDVRFTNRNSKYLYKHLD